MRTSVSSHDTTVVRGFHLSPYFTASAACTLPRVTPALPPLPGMASGAHLFVTPMDSRTAGCGTSLVYLAIVEIADGLQLRFRAALAVGSECGGASKPRGV